MQASAFLVDGMLATEPSSSSLLSLPQLPLQTVIKCLDRKDRQSLAGTCREMAVAVSAASPKTRLTLTEHTGWQGLSKVLGTRTLTCERMLVRSRDTLNHQTIDTNSALDMLLKSGDASGYLLPGIQFVQIIARPLRCLLPVNVARLLPDLESLFIQCEPGQYVEDDDLQPLPYCSSLQKLIYVVSPLPSKHHTAEDLRQQLPHVVSLELMEDDHSYSCIAESQQCINTFLTAWGGQLTELTVDVFTEPKQLLHCTRLQSLTLHGDETNRIATFLPQSLTSLSVYGKLTESTFQTILQLPALLNLSFTGFTDILQQDWSEHPCTWQQLRLTRLHVEALAKLPLHSLKGEGCLNVMVLELPDPLLADSLANVMHAAECVSRVNLMIYGFWDWECSLLNQSEESHVDTRVDTALAQLICAAGKVVRPCSIYQPHRYNMQHCLHTRTAMINWMSPALQVFCIRKETEVQPWFWQALQCCSHLVEVSFQSVVDTFQDLGTVSSITVQAAEHLVAVTRRPLSLEFTASNPPDIEESQDPTAQLMSRLAADLPKTVKLQSCFWDCSSWTLPPRLVVNLTPGVQPDIPPNQLV